MLQVDTIKAVAEGALHEVLGKLVNNEEEGRTGGYLRVFTGDVPENGLLGGWKQIFEGEIGGPYPREKRDKFWLLSMEKAIRLMKNYPQNAHWSSFESARDDWGEYQGAVLLRSILPHRLLVSFSGLPAFADEALCLLVARNIGWVATRQCDAVLRVTKNKFGQELLAV